MDYNKRCLILCLSFLIIMVFCFSASFVHADAWDDETKTLYFYDDNNEIVKLQLYSRSSAGFSIPLYIAEDNGNIYLMTPNNLSEGDNYYFGYKSSSGSGAIVLNPIGTSQNYCGVAIPKGSQKFGLTFNDVLSLRDSVEKYNDEHGLTNSVSIRYSTTVNNEPTNSYNYFQSGISIDYVRLNIFMKRMLWTLGSWATVICKVGVGIMATFISVDLIKKVLHRFDCLEDKPKSRKRGKRK